MSARVAIGETLASALRLVADRRGELFRVGLVLILGIFAIGVFALIYVLPLYSSQVAQVGGPAAGQPMSDPRLFPGMLLMLVAEFIFIAIFAVGWHRLILLGAGAGGGLGIGVGRRELVYLGHMWLCFIGLLIMSFVLAFIEVIAASALGADPWNFVGVALLGFVPIALYVLGRIAPAFAAISVDLPGGFAAAWAATRGEGARLLAINLLLCAGWFAVSFVFSLIAQVLGLGRAAPYALLFINAILICAFMAVLVSVNCIVFRRLSGWRPAS
jgi:hypothetical protein